MLTDVQMRKAKAAEKAYKLADAAGLHLFVSAAGGKLWRYRYEIHGKEKLLSLGAYPDVSLADARAARDEARADVKAGRDPSFVKKLRKLTARQHQGETFEVIAKEWHDLKRPAWAEKHATDVLDSLTRDVFPRIGTAPIRSLTGPAVLALVREVERRGSRETARRIRQRISSISQYAIATGRAETDPAASIGDVMAPLRKGRQPAITDLVEARQILADAEATPAHPVTKLALRLLALTAARPGVIIGTPWTEFADLDPAEPVWRVPAARMKLRVHLKDDEERDHLIPLSPQAIETIDAIRLMTGKGPFVFPNGRSALSTMSENAIGYLLNRAGYHHRHVPHGWRATFSSVMNERFPADRAIIDLMLAHVPKDKVESAYNRAAHTRRRRELALLWADLIMEGRPAAANLLNGRRRGVDGGAGLEGPQRPYAGKS
ncbi:integrase arm-type DNA-binding domain-containing protein [Lichenihabitans sp. Uapishka_5]|uniref:tyrosine-type recombinase/integrase n=1 Tax=Lichenihabitans sp. Uapishka_5 TaxID=3037302 RepID=UPI0029E7F358|nr:integrase arm-type DNA-binding domain-containing protein [Lichenihabitans sp. Uapishka_5]MDX7952197.1 integrase arm-type DNA-binding domain-containing protein [Lichenihabitans sp. Uapishka_5]